MQVAISHYGLQVLRMVELLKRFAKTKIFNNLSERDDLNKARAAVNEPVR